MRKLLFLLPILLLSCNKSDDDNDSPGNQTTPTLNITVLSKDFVSSEIIEMDVTTNGGAINETNLTQDLNLPSNADRTFSKNTRLTWYERNANFDLWQKDLNTMETFFYNSPCDIGQDLPWMADNSQNALFFETFTSTSASQFYIYDGSGCTSLVLEGFRILNMYSYDDTVLLYVFSRTNDDIRKILKINTNSGQITGELPLTEAARITVWDNELHVFYIDNTYRVFSLSDFSPMGTSTFELSYDGLNVGFFYTKFIGNNMLIKQTYAQPGIIPNGPALVDLSTNELTTPSGLLFEIINNLNEPNNTFYQPTGAYDAQLEFDLVVSGYTDGLNDHGILVTNFLGEIIENIPLDHRPTEIIIRN